MPDSDPVGTGEIAERLNVEHQTVRAWKARGLLPPERWTIGGRPVWDWDDDIKPWAQETGRLKTPAPDEGAATS